MPPTPTPVKRLMNRSDGERNFDAFLEEIDSENEHGQLCHLRHHQRRRRRHRARWACRQLSSRLCLRGPRGGGDKVDETKGGASRDA